MFESMLRKDLAPEDRGEKELFPRAYLCWQISIRRTLGTTVGTRVVCAPLCSDKVPPVATALKSGCNNASSCLGLAAAAVCLGSHRRLTRGKRSREVSRVSLSHFCALRVWKFSNSDLSLSWIPGRRAWRPCRSFELGDVDCDQKKVRFSWHFCCLLMAFLWKSW